MTAGTFLLIFFALMLAGLTWAILPPSVLRPVKMAVAWFAIVWLSMACWIFAWRHPTAGPGAFFRYLPQILKLERVNLP